MIDSREPLQAKFADTRRWWRMTRALGGLGWAVCAVIALGLACYHADRSLVLSATAREIWLAVLVLTGLGALSVALLRPLLRLLPDKMLAADVERHYPALRERLLTTVDLAPALAGAASGSPSGSPSGFSLSLASSLAEETRRVSAELDFRRAVNLRPLRAGALAFACALAFLGVEVVLAPQAFGIWLARMAHPRADIAPFAATRVWVKPDADILPRGEPLTVTIATEGARADRCTLRYHLEGDSPSDWTTISLARTSPRAKDAAKGDKGAGPFQYRIPSLARSVELYATANDGRSNAQTVRVEDRPTFLAMRLTLHFPAYLHRPAQVLTQSNGNVVAPVGTEVEAEATANKSLRSVGFARDGKEGAPWKIDGALASGHLSIAKDGAYTLKPIDLHGFRASAAPKYDIRAIKDQTPTVQITRPATDIDLVPDGSLPLVAHAVDDYSVVNMKLLYVAQRSAQTAEGATKVTTTAHGALDLPGPDGKPQAQVAVRWNIGGASAHPGDTLRYEVTATDNDTLNGPHTGHSFSYNVHVVSLPEMQRRLKDQLDEEARALAQLRKRQIDTQRQIAKLRLKPDKAEIARAQDAQRANAQEAQSISQRVGELTTQLRNNNLATKSEAERRDRAEQILRDLAKQKMPAAADTIQRAAATNPKSPQTAQTLQQAQREAADIRHDIEKAQDALSRTATPDQLAAEAARLAKEQQRLADASRSMAEDMQALKRDAKSARTAQQRAQLEAKRQFLRAGIESQRDDQAQTNADTQRFQKQMEQAAQAAKERGDTRAAAPLSHAANQMRQSDLAGNQQQAESRLQQSQPAAAAPPQDRAADALQKAANAAQQAAAENKTDTPAAAADRLDQAAERLREMAARQREVDDKIAKDPNSAESKRLANEEKQLQQQAGQMQSALNNAPDAQQSAGAAQQNLGQSSSQLGKGSPKSAQSPAKSAQKNLERAAQQAARAAQQLRQQQAAKELRDRVERLAQIQHGLQHSTERLHKAEENGILSDNDRQEINQVAARQSRIQEEARDLADRFPSPAFQRALRKASRQMAPATKNLDHDPNPITNAETQAAQGKAARTLDTIAQALKEQAQGDKKGDDSPSEDGGGMSPDEAKESEALGELMLSRGLQQELRDDTGALDQARAHNHENTLNKAQQQQSDQLSQGEQESQRDAEQAGQELDSIPGVGEDIQQATHEMTQAQRKLTEKQTGRPTQSNQEEALRRLDQAVNKVQQAMQQQQQQQQAQQQAQQGAPQPSKQHGSSPDRRALTRLEDPQRGAMSSPAPRGGKGLDSLSQRTQRVLREGQQERVPAEFQDLVDRYYKSLAEQKR